MAPRRPRDIEAELKALQDKARQLRIRQKSQLGELLLSTGAADALDPDALAGLLLRGLEQAKSDPKAVEGWRKRGEAFFRREREAAASADVDSANDPAPAPEPPGRTAPPAPRQAAE
ncbi:conjugal transfer protein TraD [Roseomonas sp. KE2513]|uniref:conjugal transfer protein TraD n=1 Tax=Roseomonas sp. KE2513 TaxID=2479202 RepID=UPI0018DF9402|nr:conjugal transfer protein TraD [Roseomonas sp. KE2513]MBI0539134.1 conjugal transfer protein TraD [Roseomonas sp. KE2513]